MTSWDNALRDRGQEGRLGACVVENWAMPGSWCLGFGLVLFIWGVLFCFPLGLSVEVNRCL